MTTELTADNLYRATVGGERDVEDFRQEDGSFLVPYVVYLDKDGNDVKYDFQAAKDENGFRIVGKVENKVYTEDQESELEEELEEYDFTYEGGYIPGLGRFRMVDNGHMGDGHEAWSLVEHESGRFFRFGGWYSSWGESGWDKCVEVVPAQVTVVRYADINDHSKVFDNPAVTV